VLLDLSAALDTIDHKILLDRLQNYTGIQGQALDCGLDCTYQFVYLNGIIQVNVSKLWSASRVCFRPSAIFNIHAAHW